MIYREGGRGRNWGVEAKEREKTDTFDIRQAPSLSPDMNLLLSQRMGSISHAFQSRASGTNLSLPGKPTD